MAAAAAAVWIGCASIPTALRPYAAFVTLFERMQRVQTLMRFTLPLTRARTDWMFASNRRRVTLWAWLTFRPTAGPFPQISQRLAIVIYTLAFGTNANHTTDSTLLRRASSVTQCPGMISPEPRSTSGPASVSDVSAALEAVGERNTRFSSPR